MKKIIGKAGFKNLHNHFVKLFTEGIVLCLFSTGVSQAFHRFSILLNITPFHSPANTTLHKDSIFKSHTFQYLPLLNSDHRHHIRKNSAVCAVA
ncbi:MAG: hypothetical protein V4642_06840 [Bacteroidota bacterium]